jgi:hypothetical protein
MATDRCSYTEDKAHPVHTTASPKCETPVPTACSTVNIGVILKPMFSVMCAMYKKPGPQGPQGCKGLPGAEGPTVLSCEHQKAISDAVCVETANFAKIFTEGMVECVLSDVKETACAFERAYTVKNAATTVRSPWVRADSDVMARVDKKLNDDRVKNDGSKKDETIQVIRTMTMTIGAGFVLVHAVFKYKNALSAAELIYHPSRSSEEGISLLHPYRVVEPKHAAEAAYEDSLLPSFPLGSVEEFIHTFTGEAERFLEVYVRASAGDSVAC